MDYGFTGKRYDPETGLYYFNARYFLPGLGQFASNDPAGYIDGMNLRVGHFAMAGGMDPHGLWKIKR